MCYISRTIIGDICTFFFRSSRHRSLFYRSHFIHLAFRNTLQKTPCEKSIWNRFYDLYKITDLGSRNGSSSFFLSSHEISVPPILNYLPMLRFQWNFAHLFITRIPRVGFFSFSINSFFVEIWRFSHFYVLAIFHHVYCGSSVPPILIYHPMLQFQWNLAHSFIIRISLVH